MAHRLYRFVAERARRGCEYCLAPESLFNSPFEVEHIIPRKRGGTDDESNLALACRSCNSSKSQAISARDPLTGQADRLFNPRVDSWNEHFIVDLATAEIAGHTPVGRSTVVRLKLNGPHELRARRLWVSHFGFPDEP